MLEFQEGFFEQEVRDGFYLDVTMKTLWAAEMELLGKISEVCEKYGLQWYAAYGTLLGAIRHEGYVPWDDDMDIWMMRKDYNKLMEVLPKELPEGYRVRGPLTDEGYDQFHTCVNNGSGISIAKKWLEENHNCPFTVGIDIFPLDYLPRNKKDREMQKSLFTLVGRVAQVAKNLARGKFDEDGEMTRTEAVAQVKEGLKYLKKNYKFSLDARLIADEEWGKVTSEVWKWGNYVASMYKEEESDYIVEYLDWVKWETKQFPKEWFAETYAAQFENFMLPIPWKYDEVLSKIYSKYNVIIRNDASHEYPFYARQLRQLRQYVKEAERGIFRNTIEEVEAEKEDLPNEIRMKVEKEQRNGKKIVLSANNIALYQENPAKALDELEERLSFFEKQKEKVTLWWRPHPLMELVLQNFSGQHLDRYMRILSDYKEAGWGICDENDNTEWAVENCDIYYGELNAVLQPFQHAGKTIVLCENIEDRNKNNRMATLLARTFVNFADFVNLNDKIYFSNTNYNALVVVDKCTKKIEEMIPFEQEEIGTKNLHLHCVENKGIICFLPKGDGAFRFFDPKSKKQVVKEIDVKLNDSNQFPWNSYKTHEDVYFLPGKAGYGLWLWETEKNNCMRQNWWNPGEIDGELKHARIDDKWFITLVKKTNVMLMTNVEEKKVIAYLLPDNDVCTIQGDGKVFWYTKWDDPYLVRWDVNSNATRRILIHTENYLGKHVTPYYYASYMVNNLLFITTRLGEELYVLNTETEEIQCIYETVFNNWEFLPEEKEPFFNLNGDKLIVSLRNTNKFFAVNVKSMEVQEFQDYFDDSELKEYRNDVLMQRGALLYEDGDLFTVEKLLIGDDEI